MASVLTLKPIEADPGRRLNRKIRCVPWNRGLLRLKGQWQVPARQNNKKPGQPPTWRPAPPRNAVAASLPRSTQPEVNPQWLPNNQNITRWMTSPFGHLASSCISRGKRSRWSRMALLKCLSKVGLSMGARFRRDMLGSWSIESSQDGKTWTSRSLGATEKRNSDRPCTHGSVGTSSTYDWPVHQLPLCHRQPNQVLVTVKLRDHHRHQKGAPVQLVDHHRPYKGVPPVRLPAQQRPHKGVQVRLPEHHRPQKRAPVRLEASPQGTQVTMTQGLGSHRHRLRGQRRIPRGLSARRAQSPRRLLQRRAPPRRRKKSLHLRS